jgi:hypothetical protein
VVEYFRPMIDRNRPRPEKHSALQRMVASVLPRQAPVPPEPTAKTEFEKIDEAKLRRKIETKKARTERLKTVYQHKTSDH